MLELNVALVLVKVSGRVDAMPEQTVRDRMNEQEAHKKAAPCNCDSSNYQYSIYTSLATNKKTMQLHPDLDL